MKTRKILINADYGGFGLSDEAKELYLTKKGISFTKEERRSFLFDEKYYFYIDGEYFSEHDLKRDDPIMIEIFEQLGSERFSSTFCTVKVVEIPFEVEWILCEYDGNEWIAEKHRIWQ
jgi:hypothetical protein